MIAITPFLLSLKCLKKYFICQNWWRNKTLRREKKAHGGKSQGGEIRLFDWQPLRLLVSCHTQDCWPIRLLARGLWVDKQRWQPYLKNEGWWRDRRHLGRLLSRKVIVLVRTNWHILRIWFSLRYKLRIAYLRQLKQSCREDRGSIVISDFMNLSFVSHTYLDLTPY